MFRKGGIKDMDNWVAEEAEMSFPGIIDATGTARDANYIDTNGLYDLIERDFNGDISWQQGYVPGRHGGGEVESLKSQIDQINAKAQIELAKWEERVAAGDVSPATAEFMAGMQAKRGFFVDLDAYAARYPDPDAQIEKDLREYLAREWGDMFTDPEVEEIFAAVTTRGGDAEYLIEEIAARNYDALEVRSNEEWLGESAGLDRQGGADFAEPEFDGSPAGGSRADFEDVAPPRRTSLTDAQRTEIAVRQQQSRIRRLDGNTGDAGPLFNDQADMFGGRSDLFSDTASPQAAAIHDQVQADLRANLESLGDDAAAIREILDDLDADAEFNAVLDACGGGK
jgi:hypothetical protein